MQRDPQTTQLEDDYGNPLNEDGSCDELLYCVFPDCGCDGARLCTAKNGASGRACALNIEKRSKPKAETKIAVETLMRGKPLLRLIQGGKK